MDGSVADLPCMHESVLKAQMSQACAQTLALLTFISFMCSKPMQHGGLPPKRRNRSLGSQAHRLLPKLLWSPSRRPNRRRTQPSPALPPRNRRGRPRGHSASRRVAALRRSRRLRLPSAALSGPAEPRLPR